jgi:uncharacterized protein YjiS (DUF1127 family)
MQGESVFGPAKTDRDDHFEEQAMSSLSLTLSRPRFSLSRIAGCVWRLILALELAMQVRRERRMLLALDDRALKDVGFRHGDAQVEAQRSFWDLPVDRLRV